MTVTKMEMISFKDCVNRFDFGRIFYIDFPWRIKVLAGHDLITQTFSVVVVVKKQGRLFWLFTSYKNSAYDYKICIFDEYKWIFP